MWKICSSLSRSCRPNARRFRLHVEQESYKPLPLAYAIYDTSLVRDDWPIILMHDLLGCKQNWNYISKQIHKRTQRQVISVDARNHGESPHSSDFTYHHMVEDIRSLMGELNTSKAIVIGHSMGGKTMMALALKYPSLVERLVAVDAPILGPPRNVEAMEILFALMRQFRAHPDESLISARKAANAHLESFVPDSFTRQFILTNLVEQESKIGWRLNLEAITKNFRMLMAFPEFTTTYKGPALFVTGAKMSSERDDNRVTIRKLFPRAEFASIIGSERTLHSQNPSAFINAVCEFLQVDKTDE